MRSTRLIAVLVGVVASIAVLAPGAGSRPAVRQVCKVEYVSGLEVVFGRFKTHPPAVAFRNRVVGNGFTNASIIEGCDGLFRVVVRGFETFDTAVDLQAEAASVYYPATIECIKGKDDVGELEVVFGHRRSRAEAEQLVARAADSGFVGLRLEPDPCGGFEIMIAGFKDRAQADDFVREAKAHNFDVVIEKS